MTLDESLTAVVREAVAPLVAEMAGLREQVAALRAPAAPDPALLSVREFAARARLSACTVRRRLKDETLASTRIGRSIRIPASALRPADPSTIARLSREARS